MVDFTFGQVEATLAAINGIADHKRVAFAGRLKFLLKNDLLDGRRSKPGRGKSGAYTFSQMMQLALGVELLAFGLTPQRTAQLVQRNWGHLRHSTYLATFLESEAKDFAEVYFGDTPVVDWLWLIHANALAELTTDGASEYDTYEAIEAVELKQLPNLIDMYGHIGEAHGRRTMLINGSALTRTVLHKIGFDFRFATIEAMREDLLEEARSHEAEMNRVGGLFPNITDEQRADLLQRLREVHQSDFSTNPPTPPSVVKQRASEILARLSPCGSEVLRRIAVDQQVLVTDETRPGLHELVDLGVIEMPENRLQQYGDYSFDLTVTGKVVMNRLTESDGSDHVGS